MPPPVVALFCELAGEHPSVFLLTVLVEVSHASLHILSKLCAQSQRGPTASRIYLSTFTQHFYHFVQLHFNFTRLIKRMKRAKSTKTCRFPCAKWQGAIYGRDSARPARCVTFVVEGLAAGVVNCLLWKGVMCRKTHVWPQAVWSFKDRSASFSF